MRNNTLVLFDIGAVLVKLQYANFYKEAAKYSSLSLPDLEEKYLKSNLDIRVTRGEIDTREFMIELKDCLKLKPRITDEEIEKIIGATFPDQISDMIDLKEEIHNAGHAVGLFSNIGEPIHRILQARYPKMFEVYNPKNPLILSYQHKTMKPEAAIYDTIRGFNTVIFIDDKDRYLQVGIERGWKGIQYVEYLDQTEPQRKAHADTRYHHENLRIARSTQEVKRALREFGIKI